MSSSTQSTPKLPMLTAHGKGNEVLFQAYVNSYVIGTRGGRMNGRWAYPLYWVSLVGMRGQGTLLQGIFARLVATSPRQVSLSDLSDVQLAHHHPQLANLGYTLHWNFEQTEIAPQRDLHAVIESRMLTCVDPARGTALIKRGRGSESPAGSAGKGKGKSVSGRASLSTAKGSAMQLGASEVVARERNPLFLLFAQADVPERRAQSHLAFLDQRLPWPLLPEWADFLWERGLTTGEIEPLTVWNATQQQGSEARASGTDSEEEEEEDVSSLALSTSTVRPLFTEAYLCRPRAEKLLGDLQQALRTGELSTSTSRSLGHVQEEEQKLVREQEETRQVEEAFA